MRFFLQLFPNPLDFRVGKRVIVMTHRPTKAHNAEEFYSGSVLELANRLTDEKRVYVDGGKVLSQFFAAGLIEDVTISVIPIVLGNGIRLFSGGEGEHRLDLESSRFWPSGMVQMRYRVRRTPGLTEGQTGPR